LIPVAQISGSAEGAGLRVAVVASRYNERIVEALLEGAVDCLLERGVAKDEIVVARVPGAWEIPQAAEEIAAAGAVDAIVTVGVLIRGETPHFDHICIECARGVGRAASRYRMPISFGVLTCENSAQAEARAGGGVGNKGREAAMAALDLATLFRELRA